MKLSCRLTSREPLRGSRPERIVQILRKAGWYPGRRVDISHVLDYYQGQGVALNGPAISFHEEYSGIASQWYFMHTNSARHAPDFNFLLFPQPPEYRTDIKDFMYSGPAGSIESDEYSTAKAFAGEPIVLIGEIGCYYPARVWIGGSGTLYSTHEYNNDILGFDSVPKLLLAELSNLALESVAMKQ